MDRLPPVQVPGPGILQVQPKGGTSPHLEWESNPQPKTGQWSDQLRHTGQSQSQGFG